MDLVKLNLNKTDEPEANVPVSNVPVLKVSLTLPQFGMFLFLLVPTLFTAGIYYESRNAELSRKQIEIEIQAMKIRNEELQNNCPVAEIKQSFKSLVTRLEAQKKKAARSPLDKKLQNDVANTQEMLAKFLDRNIHAMNKNGVPIMTIDRDVENYKNSTVKFKSDSTPYTVPNEVKDLTKDVYWNNSTTTPQDNALKAVSAIKIGNNTAADLNKPSVSSPNNNVSFPNRTRVTLEIKDDFPSPQPF
jgi:hypothetical protein